MLKVTKYQKLMPDPFDILIVKIVFFFHEATRYAQSCRTAPFGFTYYHASTRSGSLFQRRADFA
jgi:hypothetical protein